MIWSQVLGLLSLSLEWPSPDGHMPPLPYFPQVYRPTSSSQGALPGHCVQNVNTPTPSYASPRRFYSEPNLVYIIQSTIHSMVLFLCGSLC